MAFIHDPDMQKAMDDLTYGDGEALAALFESGRFTSLVHFLTDRHPEHQAKVARALRGKSVQGRGKPSADRAREKRDEFLLIRVAYWRGYGASGWQVDSWGTAFHRAAADLEREPVKGAPIIGPETIYRRVWKESSPNIMQSVLMADAFGRGLSDSQPSKPEMQRRLAVANRELELEEDPMAAFHLKWWIDSIQVD